MSTDLNKEITDHSFRLFLATFIEQNSLNPRKVARSIGCSEPTFNRIIAYKTLPTERMMKQGAIMIELGFKDYKKLTHAQKEKISEIMGCGGGTTLGFASVTAAVSAAGISGLSAAGITSGLAAIGALVGGGMMTGITIVAAIPIAMGALGYALIKAIKSVLENNKFDQENYDPFWEKPMEELVAA